MPRSKHAAAVIAAALKFCLFSTAMAYAVAAHAAAVIVNSPESIAGTYPGGVAQFGPPVTRAGVSGETALAFDVGGASTADGCSALTNAADVAGRIALVDRGTCTFVTKARNLQQAGATAMIVVNNVPGPQVGMAGDGTELTNPITIPSLMVSQADGNLIKGQLTNGVSVTVTMVPGIVLSSIAVTPADPTIVVGNTQQFTATGTFNDGNSSVLINHVPASVVAKSANAHTCAILIDGGVRCWGLNSRGRLGNGTTTDSPTPVPVTGIADAHSVSAGVNHTCALVGGMGHCWGSNDDGQLGDGTTIEASTPVAVSGLSAAQSIVAGGAHSCANLIGGTVKCWGRNLSGQLGDETNADSKLPVTVAGLSGVSAVTAGNNHNCALLTNGTVQCWGGNFSGQLGNGTTTDSNIPRPVSGLSGVQAVVASGLGHTCALMVDGTVQCWGRNDFGQLGDGSTTDSWMPVVVSGVSGAIAVTAGWTHTCALVSDGTARCWGRNNRGQLGDGTLVDSTAPVAVSGLANVQALAGGFDHTCALIDDGTARCWGWNDFGQAGDGTAGYDVLLPVTVVGIGPTLSWSSSASAVATIEANGLATGLSAATTTITAESAGVKGSTKLTVAPPGTTLPGSEVAVQPIDPTTQTSPVTVTFASVTATGTTTVTTSDPGKPPASAFKLLGGTKPVLYEIATTATVSGPIEVCVSYADIRVVNEAKLRLFHLRNGVWVNVTSRLDTVNDVICGTVDSL